MAEVLEQTVGETSTKALQDRQERPAFQPDIKLPEDKEAVERMFEGGDLEYTMSFEILPKIELADLASITLEKSVAEPQEDDVKKALERLLKANVSFEPKDGGAEEGDRLTIDYKGSVDGEPFEGGAGEDAFVIIGSKRFIPGFEEGVAGAKTGENREVRVTFPEDYQAKELAGKDAVFDVAVKEVARAVEPKPDDEFAKSLGMETFARLEEAVRDQLQKELDTISRNKLKKALLDALDEKHAFDMPPSLVEGEFEAVWRNVTRQLEQSKKTFEEQGTTEEKAKEEYRTLAERRVRLGLILAEIGNINEIRVGDEEIRRAIIERARQFPGQEREVVEYYRKNPQAMNELRAPVYEDKVMNFALELVKTDDKKVTPAQLMEFAAEEQREQALLDGDDGHEHHHHDDECGPGCDHDHEHHHHG